MPDTDLKPGALMAKLDKVISSVPQHIRDQGAQ
jgi:hypothetical protein